MCVLLWPGCHIAQKRLTKSCITDYFINYSQMVFQGNFREIYHLIRLSSTISQTYHNHDDDDDDDIHTVTTEKKICTVTVRQYTVTIDETLIESYFAISILLSFDE